MFNNKILASQKIKNEVTAFQPARDNPNIFKNTSSHLIGDLFNKYVSVSFENSILDEHPSGPVQKYISIPKWYNPAKELESQRIAPPSIRSFLEIKVFFMIKIIMKLYAMIAP